MDLLKRTWRTKSKKKFKKGEISLDKAFELAKKIESKMSQDKNNEERADRIQKEADKYPTIERASQQRQIGKAIRRNQRKNALTFESLEKAMEVLEQLLGESKAKDPKGYKENMDIANHYDKLYSKEPAKAPDGSPNSVAAEWNRRYQHYFDKAMKCYYGDNKKEPLKEALKILEGWAKDKRPEAAKKVLKSREKEHFRALGNALDAADVYGADNCEPEAKEANRAAARVAHAKNVIANEALEKGIVILEQVINEYNIDKVKAALDKRTEQSMKADDEERKEFNDILNMKDRDKRAEAYKEFSKKSDKRFNDGNKKLDLYAKYAKKHPELVEALTLMYELFDGPDLIDDDIVGQKGFTKKLIRKGTAGAIKAIRHGVQKAVDRKSCSEDFDKNEEKEYNECKALQLWEQVINEIEDSFFRKVLNKSEKEQEDVEKMKDLATTKKSKDAIDDVLIPRRHRHEVVNSKFEDKVVKRAEDEYRNSKKKKGK